MNRLPPAQKTYTRPMAGWWRRNPFFLRYMLREASALFLLAYALLLLAGIACLARGEAAFGAWLAVLASPPSLLLHGVALAFVGYHSLTWFQVMPKTAPRLPFPGRWITLGGLAASALLSLALLLWVAW